jgi:hypothetical protein
VCVSTHSPQVLEAVWAIERLREAKAGADQLLDLFGARHTHPMRVLAEKVLEKKLKVYYFDRKSNETRDISGLDPDAAEFAEASWGGLAEFSAAANDAVAKAVSNSGAAS